MVARVLLLLKALRRLAGTLLCLHTSMEVWGSRWDVVALGVKHVMTGCQPLCGVCANVNMQPMLHLAAAAPEDEPQVPPLLVGPSAGTR